MIPYGYHYIDEDDIAAVVTVLRDGALTQGPVIAKFEQAIANYVGAKYAVAVSSGTAALHLACIAAGIGEGDDVITSPNTFIASANCALFVGANPDFADIQPETLNLDPEALAIKCAGKKKLKAIIPVHFAGLPCDMPAIHAIARRYQAAVIEDATHALGASYPQGGRVGNCAFSDMTVFSFHPVKTIAAGEGGMITMNDERLYRKLLRLRSHGINKGDDPFLMPANAFHEGKQNRWYYEMQELGYNYRISDIQSALGLSQSRKLDKFLTQRRNIAFRYDKAFAGLPHISLTQLAGRYFSSHHLYVLRIKFGELNLSRQQFMGILAEQGIGSQVHYIPVHTQPFYTRLGFKPGDFHEAERYYDEALSIPIFFKMSNDDQQKVIDTIKQILLSGKSRLFAS